MKQKKNNNMKMKNQLGESYFFILCLLSIMKLVSEFGKSKFFCPKINK